MLVLSAPIFAGSYPARAQPPDPVTAGLNRCLDGPEGSTTSGQLNCIGKAEQSWDARLNQVYGTLMRTLDPASRAQLQAAQRAWLDYRKKDADFASGPWRAQTGTLAQVLIGRGRLDEMAARVETLETYARGD